MRTPDRGAAAGGGGDHVVLSDLPELERRTSGLFTLWNQQRTAFDLFVKIDAVTFSWLKGQTEVILRILATWPRDGGDGRLWALIGARAAWLHPIADASYANASFLGIVGNDALPDLHRDCDTFASASQYEGHPKAVIEAMACGLPVVATVVRGLRDVIVHDQTGLLVEASAAAFAASAPPRTPNAAIASRLCARPENRYRKRHRKYPARCVDARA